MFKIFGFCKNILIFYLIINSLIDRWRDMFFFFKDKWKCLKKWKWIALIGITLVLNVKYFIKLYCIMRYLMF